ncbi:metal ABC transporter ATP-binding protein [Deinococcus wulumuqiensis]|uniref:Manganese ABC transporter ATP-binding protein n=2 Tax=Deinococcus wulumuqiensis TaxID=980427 RepID=A0A345IHV1_9DEIO|nr:metal ABC transporter ATP-binding protein [Deinococcus wulumuqiensis]AXG99273.1 metal ABC transporter ATP-binding protein [Deinococcus wulumuqiensis]QII21610.1 metal ABC transporter ATP-binding protein [Deinococcus wulumuqiensis R12]GGI90195.1 manganese ABC transporter ATP-binding protein [Deinococcus wulumuqiensis]GGP30737.1 manganese ABC transporter ATP-binding protein [Deinococcus wulumuqiensis]
MLGVEGLTVCYGPQVALRDVTLRFEAGQFTALIGPNGAGKSTLLRALTGLLGEYEGQVTYDPGHSARSCLCYVPQQQTLDWGFPVTVWDTAMMGRTSRLGWGRWPGARDRQIVADALKETGVYDLRHRHIGALSGGQRQRVLLARMLARQGHLLLLDEPLTGVDVTTQEQLMALLRAQADQGRAVVMVTHDLEQARRWCDRIVLINRRVIADGRPDAVYTPQNIEATFTGGGAHG